MPSLPPSRFISCPDFRLDLIIRWELGPWSRSKFIKSYGIRSVARLLLSPTFPSQAFRVAVPKLDKLVAAAKPGAEGVSTLREIAAAWSAMSKAHDVHAMHEDKVIFPALEGFFPGQVGDSFLFIIFSPNPEHD